MWFISNVVYIKCGLYQMWFISNVVYIKCGLYQVYNEFIISRL
jgi:hypothetical protein